MIQIKTDICKLIFCFFFTFNLSEGSQLNLILKINTRQFTPSVTGGWTESIGGRSNGRMLVEI